MTTADSNDNWLYIGPDTQGFHIREMNGNGDCIAHVPLERHAARIVANHNAVPKLVEALRAMLECSRCTNGCAPDDMTCATNLADAALAIATTTTQPDAGEGQQ